MVKETNLYDTLGIHHESTSVEIKKAYRLNALKYHPDKNNHSQESTEKFQEVTKAYEVLSDDQKRKIYDQYGEEGINNITQANGQQNGQSNGNGNTNGASNGQSFSMRADDLFNQFFGESFFSSNSFGSSFSTSSSQNQFPGGNGFHNGNAFPNGFPSFNNNNYQQYNNNYGNGSNANGNGNSRPMRRGVDIKHKISVSLEELYHGRSTKLALSRTILCSSCNAKGGERVRTCSQCKGHGYIVMSKQMGPLIQRFESSCKLCNGTGTFINEQDLCPVCHGDKTVEEEKILELDIPPGTTDGEHIVFKGEGDQGVNIIPGDVVVTIEEKPHQVFKRRDEDLFTRVKIDLLTALGGGSFGLQHINNDWLKIDIIPGEIIKPNCLKQIPNLGMPKRQFPNEYGTLVIQFCVEFPDSAQIQQGSLPFLEKSLPPRPALNIPSDVEYKEKILMDYEPHHYFKKHGKNSKKRKVGDDDNDEDDEDGKNNNGRNHGDGNGMNGVNSNVNGNDVQCNQQ